MCHFPRDYKAAARQARRRSNDKRTPSLSRRSRGYHHSCAHATHGAKQRAIPRLRTGEATRSSATHTPLAFHRTRTRGRKVRLETGRLCELYKCPKPQRQGDCVLPLDGGDGDGMVTGPRGTIYIHSSRASFLDSSSFAGRWPWPLWLRSPSAYNRGLRSSKHNQPNFQTHTDPSTSHALYDLPSSLGPWARSFSDHTLLSSLPSSFYFSYQQFTFICHLSHFRSFTFVQAYLSGHLLHPPLSLPNHRLLCDTGFGTFLVLSLIPSSSPSSPFSLDNYSLTSHQ